MLRIQCPPLPDPPDFSKVIASILGPDPRLSYEGWDRLLRWMVPFLCRVLCKAFKLRPDDDRLEGFLAWFPGELWMNEKGRLSKWNPALGRFETWLTTIARNSFTDHDLRKPTTGPKVFSIDQPRSEEERATELAAPAPDDPEEQEEGGRNKAKLLAAVLEVMRMKLQPQHRMVLKLRRGMPLIDPDEQAEFEKVFKLRYAEIRGLEKWREPTAEFLTAQWKEEPQPKANTFVVWGVRDREIIREELKRLGFGVSW